MENEKTGVDTQVEEAPKKKPRKKDVPVKPVINIFEGNVVLSFTERIDQITFSPELAITMGRALVSEGRKAERQKLYRK